MSNTSSESSEKRIIEPELSENSEDHKKPKKQTTKESNKKAASKSKGTSGNAKSKGKKEKGAVKKSKKEVDPLCHFGTDDVQRSYSIECPDRKIKVRHLAKKFKMTTIKFLVSEEHVRLLPVDGQYFEVQPGMGYIIEGIPVGNNICRKCKKEYIEGSTKKCVYHQGDWGKINVMKKERMRDEKTGEQTNKFHKVPKEVPGWTCCESEEINAKGCAKAPTHSPSFDAQGKRIEDKDSRKKKPKQEESEDPEASPEPKKKSRAKKAVASEEASPEPKKKSRAKKAVESSEEPEPSSEDEPKAKNKGKGKKVESSEEVQSSVESTEPETTESSSD